MWIIICGVRTSWLVLKMSYHVNCISASDLGHSLHQFNSAVITFYVTWHACPEECNYMLERCMTWIGWKVVVFAYFFLVLSEIHMCVWSGYQSKNKVNAIKKWQPIHEMGLGWDDTSHITDEFSDHTYTQSSVWSHLHRFWLYDHRKTPAKALKATFVVVLASVGVCMKSFWHPDTHTHRHKDSNNALCR